MASGKFGRVIKDGTAVSTVSNWTLSDNQPGNTYIASNTDAGTGRAGGIRDWNGSFMGYGANPPVMPNDVFDFEGFTWPTNGIASDEGVVYSGPVIIQSVSINWDWTANGLISWTANFMGKPGLTVALGTVPTDASQPTREIACGTTIQWATTQLQEIPALANATLTFNAALTEESNSSTRTGGYCYVNREPGPIDWSLSCTQQDWKRGLPEMPNIGDRDLKLTISTKSDGSEWWDLVLASMESYANLVVDRATNAPISRQLNFAMNANGSGFVSRPGAPTTAWWGSYFDWRALLLSNPTV